MLPTQRLQQHQRRHKTPRASIIAVTLCLMMTLTMTTPANAAIDESISEHEGKTVVIPCPVNKDKCGELHSINWFKGDDRIAAMLLGENNVTSVSDEFKTRVTVDQNPFRLIIKDLEISDEDIYLCDTTFFIPVETCDNFNGYRVELNVLVPPTEVVILDEKGDRIENGSMVGPMQERQTLRASCVVRNTRPHPQVGWWRGNKRLSTHAASHDEKDGLYTATLELTHELSRDDLGRDIECRVESAALPSVVVYKFAVDLQVRPTSIEIKGVKTYVVQGSTVKLTCEVLGARPAVNVTWYNSTVPISDEENDHTEIETTSTQKPDGTYRTQSHLTFTALRFDNDRPFHCDAENVVLQMNHEKPFTAVSKFEVRYPPVITVWPLKIAANTSEGVLLDCKYEANPASLLLVQWYRNDELVNVTDTERYVGGNSENVPLLIRSTEKEDIGNYTCILGNDVDNITSSEKIELDVQYVPIVEVLMIPEGPVKESDESNVTLYCNILEANPAVLTKVRWYANSTLLKELPDCEETKEDLCHIDPSKLLLESIGRGFFYNYSCEGYNAAGWGPRSDDKELMVHYEPGPATLTHYPITPTKRGSVLFNCSVEDPGYPETTRYRWLRGGRPLQDIVTQQWTMQPVVLDSRTNYSCFAYNEGGKGTMATVNLVVHAPPFFIKNLSQYTGILHSAHNANLTCRIECVPRCEISWLKDNVPIEKNDTRYFIKEKYMAASISTGDFESMLSVLHFNMSNWPNQKFDIEADNANYTCISTANSAGPGIKSTTYFNIEYAPDNTTVSEKTVYVHEDTIPGRVICKSRADPEPKYEWRFNNKTVIIGNALIINTPMTRNDTGRYTCLASNKHGDSTAETFIEVQYKPRCEIERQEIDDQDTLICTAFGNPEEADFSWSIKAENETVEWLGSGDSKAYKDKSFYVLNEDYAIARTYRCVANNTVGMGTLCEIEVAEQLAWYQRWDKTTLIILIAAILALLLAVIIICCIIICICRRRRRQDKYHTDVSISATHSVLSYQPTLSPVGVVTPALQQASYPAPAAIISTPPPSAPPAAALLSCIAPMLPEKPIPLALPLTTSHLPSAATLTNSSTHTNTTSNTPTQTPPTRTPTLIVKHSAQAPKSPPRWPLRPGVMVHVSSDTKENLATNRMTLKPHQRSLAAQLSTVNAPPPDSQALTTSTAAQSTHTANVSATPLSSHHVSTLGRISGRRTARALDCGGTPNACQTLPHRRVAVAATVNPNNQILTVDNVPRQRLTADTDALNAGSALLPNAENDDDDDVNDENVTQNGTMAANVTVAADVTTNSAAELLTVDNHNDEEIEALAVATTTTTTIAPVVGSEHHQGNRRLERVEQFFAQIFKRRKNAKDSTRDSQRSHVGLLGGMFNAGAGVFWQRRQEENAGSATTTAADKSPFAVEHRLKGIRCSGSVTYKKTPVLATRNDSVTAITATAANSSNSGCNIDTPLNANVALQQQQQYKTSKSNSNIATVAATATIPAATLTTPQQQQQQQIAPSATTSPHNSPSRASVTFQMPSFGKAAANASNSFRKLSLYNNLKNTNNNNNNENGIPIAATATATTTAAATAAASLIASSNLTPYQRGILKSPTPPPRPPPPFREAPPPLMKRNIATVTPTKVERVQIQDKSSSLGDPLTEPGEYENLPFHGLQTAPNKFSTTPTNFNNNTNVVRVAPRPKRLNGSISQAHVQQQQQQGQPHQQQQLYDAHQQQLQYHQQQHQQPTQPPLPPPQYNTMQYGGRTACNQTAASSAHTLNSHNKSLQHVMLALEPGNSSSSQSQSHQITYNLNNCFPKSYTEYYHQQQQQKPPPPLPYSGNSASSAQLLNAIEHDAYPTYAVVERNNTANAKANNSTNPFLAISNFKKFDTSSSDAAALGNGYAPHILDSGTGSMQRSKRKPGLDKAEDKKFYSLKFSGGKGKALHKPSAAAVVNGGLGLNASMMLMGGGAGGSTLGNNKCKRHHSFAGGSIGDIDSVGPGVPQSQHHPMQIKSTAMRFYDPPVYENLAHDPGAVQIHECAVVEAHTQPAGEVLSGTATILLHAQPSTSGGGSGGGHHAAHGTGHKKKHHHRQHQPKDDFNLIEPERLSIYRSDSGISNSSYECVTPVPALSATAGGSSSGRASIIAGTPPPKTPKSIKSGGKGATAGSLAASTVAANFKKSPRLMNNGTLPVYMNVEGQTAGLERSCSPVSTLVNSSYESASSSQNENGTAASSIADPTSLSSSNSLYSSGTGTLIGVGPLLKASATGASRCGLHQKPAEITTPEEFEQYQLGHHKHSASSLSVASTVSASGARKCKKQSTLAGAGSINGIERFAIATTNPFLASNRATKNAHTTGSANALDSVISNKKLRRQTISDPYAHISRQQFTSDSNSSLHAHHYRAQCANAFKATTTATSNAKSQQQISVQQQQQHCSKQYHHQQSLLMPRTASDMLLQQCGNKHTPPSSSSGQRLVPVGSEAAGAALGDDDGVVNVAGSGDVVDNADDDDGLLVVDMPAMQTGALKAHRPVKLPLRKYHTFHFERAQTVAGMRPCKLQQLRMQMQQQQQHQPLTAKAAFYAATGGPLVFRPLSWHENRSFKPISPEPQADNDQAKTTESAKETNTEPTATAGDEEEEYKSEMSEELAEEIKQLTTRATTNNHNNQSLPFPQSSLNPAASLEALEALTKNHPELIYATKPGSRQNLHQQLTLSRTSSETPTPKRATGNDSTTDFCKLADASDEAVEEDEEDLGYSFTEDIDDEYIDDDLNEAAASVVDERPHNIQAQTAAACSPRAAIILSPGRRGGRVKYMLSQSYREVTI